MGKDLWERGTFWQWNSILKVIVVEIGATCWTKMMPVFSSPTFP
ncbi:hypothetical protein Nmel_012808 [Mimus melanotis]